MNTYYVIHKETGEIVNAVTTSKKLPEVVDSFASVWPMHLYEFNANPPMHLLQRYRYWDERP